MSLISAGSISLDSTFKLLEIGSYKSVVYKYKARRYKLYTLLVHVLYFYPVTKQDPFNFSFLSQCAH